MTQAEEHQVRTFRDPRVERRFHRDGYVVVPFVPPEQLDAVREVYERHPSGIESGYYASIFSADRDYKEKVHREIEARLWPRLDRLLHNAELVVGAFMVKHPGPDTAVPPHQDWIVVDEARSMAVTCWIPLTDVSAEEGEMAILPGSHRYIVGLRGSPTFPTEVEAISDSIRDRLMRTVSVRVGEAIIYDFRLVHGTPPNRSDRTRLVAYMSAVSQGAPRLHYYRNSDGVVEAYQVDRDFFWTFGLGDVPDGEPFLRIPDYQVEPLSMEALEQRMRSVAPRRRRRRPVDQP